jgi:hypothetical protein
MPVELRSSVPGILDSLLKMISHIAQCSLSSLIGTESALGQGITKDSHAGHALHTAVM